MESVNYSTVNRQLRAVPTATDPVGLVRSLAPRIRELAAEAEAAGVVSTEITDALRNGGIYSLMAPTAIGGGTTEGEAHPSLLLDVIEELAAADGSTGWAVMAQMTGTGTLLALLPDEGLELVLDSDNFRTAGQIPPSGSAVPVPGGYRISGTFGFASGSSAAGWFTSGLIVKDEHGQPILDNAGQRQFLVGLAPRSDTTLTGGWDVLGLVATASVDYAYEDVFLPEHLTSRGEVLRGDTLHQGGVRLLTTLGHTGVSIGLMRAALESFKELSHAKFRPPSGLLVRHETVQSAYAGWWAKAQAAKAWAHHAFGTVFDVVANGGTATPAQEADCRLAATHAAFLAAELTEAIYTMSGSEGLRNSPDNVLQRTFRDAHAASQHMLTAPHVFVEAGRIYLETPGMEPTHYRILDHVFAPPLT